jgi:hypothetical protein
MPESIFHHFPCDIIPLMKNLYHGSYIQNLDKIPPKESGHGKPYVYATTELAFAAIFSVQVRNTFIAKWGRLKDNTPYFCEERPGAFDLFYKGKQSSIYVLDGTNFFQNDNMWKEEYISEREETILEEIRIEDVKEYLLQLEKEGQFKYISFENRKEYFPTIEQEAIENALKMIEKYGLERALIAIKKWRPDIIEEVGLKIKNEVPKRPSF